MELLDKLSEKVETAGENQAFEKFGLITAAALLTPAGVTLCQVGDKVVGLVLVCLGVLCLLVRELIKK